MRTMLLSFKPEWYNRIKKGSKIFEYRRTFPDEEILAYMYVSGKGSFGTKNRYQHMERGIQGRYTGM